MLQLNNLKNTLILILLALVFGGLIYLWGASSNEKVTAKPIILQTPKIERLAALVQLEPERRELIIGSPGIRVDSTYYFKYLEEAEENKRLQMYIDAIKIKDTTVTLVEDSIVKIDVTSKTRGTLISQQAFYTVKPQSATIQPGPYFIPKTKVFVGGAFSFPLEYEVGNPAIEANIMIERTGKGDVFRLGIDTEKRITAGYSVQLFKKK